MQTAYVFRIYPNASQQATIAQTFGCCRWVYNRCLELRQKAYRETGKTLSTNSLMKLIPGWKRENPWLAEADAVALQQAVRDLDNAYRNFFRAPGKTGFPKFKSKRSSHQSYRTQCPKGRSTVEVVDRRHVKLPKLGLVHAHVTRKVEGRILSATVSKAPTGKLFVSLCVECDDVEKWEIPENAPEITGVDAGIADFAITSEGRKLANPKAARKLERKLAREQRRLSRKQRGSANQSKQRIRVARVYEKMTNVRKDALHKATTATVRESKAVAVENLNVSGMVKNHRLARAVSDASVSEMIRQLEYKCARHERQFVKVGRFYPSSKTCSHCGHVLDELPLSVRKWQCPECGAKHDRDVNAAQNIAREGMRILNEKGTAGLAGTAA